MNGHDDFTSAALAYLLEEMPREERAAFEQRLEREPAAAAAFKGCADSLAGYLLAQAGEAPLTPAERSETLGTVFAQTGARTSARRAGIARSWTAWAWPAAAAVLLGLNLWQWGRRASAPRADQAAKVRDSASAGVGAGAGHAGATGGPNESAGGITVVSIKPGSPEALQLRRLEALRAEFQRMEKGRDAAAREYGQILNSLIPALPADSGAGRLVAMELVDNASYQRGDRNGLLDLAKSLLAAPGVVAVGPPAAGNAAPSGAGAVQQQSAPANASSGSAAGTAPAANSSIASTATTTASTGITSAPTTIVTGGASGSATAIAPPSLPTATEIGPSQDSTAGSAVSGAPSSAVNPPPVNDGAVPSSATASPYAWSVYDDTQHQGYLNLYNLPTVPAGNDLQLWVKPAGDDQYQPVGVVPAQFYGQSGSLYYKLPPQTGTPSEILITVEPVGAPPASPTGAVVLRGP